MTPDPPAPSRRRRLDHIGECVPLVLLAADRLQRHQDLARAFPRPQTVDFFIPGNGRRIAIVQERPDLGVAAMQVAMPARSRQMRRLFHIPCPEDGRQGGISIGGQERPAIGHGSARARAAL